MGHPDSFRAVADLLPEPMLLVTAAGTIEGANRAFVSAFRYASSELQARPLAAVLEVPDGNLDGYLRRCAGSRQLVLGACTIRAGGGVAVPCRCEGALHTPRTGDVSAILLLRFVRREQSVSRFVALTQRVSALSAEVSRRRRTEEALDAQRELLQVTLRSIGDAVITTDSGGRVAFMNDVAEALTGWTLAEAAGRPVTDVFVIVNEDTRDPVENPVDRVLVSGKIVGLANHTLLIGRQGVERPIDDSGAPIVDTHGRTLGAVLVFRDVTEIRRTQRQQLAARRAAEAANQAKDRFLAMLSHELRTPLNAILGWARMLQRGTVDGERLRQGLSVIERNAELQARLVDDLLDISRITEGKLELRDELFDLAGIVQAVIEAVQPAAGKRRVRLQADLHGGALVRGDADRLQQAVWNLVSNAVKFTPPGGYVDVSATRQDQEIRLIVHDSGEGFPADFKPFLFDPFSQADTSFTRVHGGLGLGLAIARRLIEAHGGTIEGVSPGPGQGAVFTITLPAQPPA